LTTGSETNCGVLLDVELVVVVGVVVVGEEDMGTT
jgi:hypothetical protein